MLWCTPDRSIPTSPGKSSLFRVLRGLWPLAGGHIVCPDDKEVYFLSQVCDHGPRAPLCDGDTNTHTLTPLQVNFVPVGSLREIIIYPHTLEDMKAAGKTDADLRQVCTKPVAATSGTLDD